MADVDPRLQRIPKQLLESREVRGYFEELERFLHDLWIRTGGGNDAIENQSIRESYPWPDPTVNTDDGETPYQSVFHQPAIEFRSVTANADYTMIDHDFVNAKSGATITFPEFPPENSVVIVRNGDGSRVKLLGNGREINGSTDGAINREGTAVTFQYFILENAWYAR